MSQPKYIEKYLKMKPEVNKIFEDLEQYKDYCRYNMLKFDERDLYRSEQYRKFEKFKHWQNKQAAEQQ